LDVCLVHVSFFLLYWFVVPVCGLGAVTQSQAVRGQPLQEGCSDKIHLR
jgi:hypothetical protein